MITLVSSPKQHLPKHMQHSASEYTNGNAQIILHAMYLVNNDEF